jgi:hypothetical protein
MVTLWSNYVTDEAATTVGLVPCQASETALPLVPVAHGSSVGARPAA